MNKIQKKNSTSFIIYDDNMFNCFIRSTNIL